MLEEILVGPNILEQYMAGINDQHDVVRMSLSSTLVMAKVEDMPDSLLPIPEVGTSETRNKKQSSVLFVPSLHGPFTHYSHSQTPQL